MSERAVPFYCPYCGDEDLRPAEAARGAWFCGSCLRTFTLTLTGIGVGGSDRRARPEEADASSA